MRTSRRFFFRCLVMITVCTVAASACSDAQKSAVNNATDQASNAASKASDLASATASRLSGPAKVASDSLTSSLSSARSTMPDAARALADNARCVSDGTVDVLGDKVVDQVRANGSNPSKAASLTADKVTELKGAVGKCVDIRKVLTDSLTGTGLPKDKASCVAEHAMNDNEAMNAILLNMVFGDPGFVAVIAIAARAGASCLSASDLAKLAPGT